MLGVVGMPEQTNKKKWYVYILQSAIHGKLYTGVSTEPNRRLIEHNTSKRGAKCTRGGRPWVLRYTEELPSKSDALRREWTIKSLSREKKLALFGGEFLD